MPGCSIWLTAVVAERFDNVLLPNLGMLGYFLNTKVGAFTYNIFHHKGIAIMMAAIGWFFSNDVLIACGILLFAHASFDRVWGYGLKHDDSFKHTHLGSL